MLHKPMMPLMAMIAKSVYANMITDTWIPNNGVCKTGCNGGLGVTTFVITKAKIIIKTAALTEYRPLR